MSSSSSSYKADIEKVVSAAVSSVLSKFGGDILQNKV